MAKLYIYLILIYFIIKFSSAKIVLNIHLYNYKNNDDLLYNSRKCETFHWGGDYCDPIFKICVTSTKKCDIIDNQTVVYNNKKVIYEVFSKTVYLDSFQKSILVEVKADDSDSYKLENIAKFKANFQLGKLPYSYSQRMQVISQNKNIFLQASVKISCYDGFIGDSCEYSVEQYKCIKSCINGKCSMNQLNKKFQCLCHLNWTGYNCDYPNSLESITTSPNILMRKFPSIFSIHILRTNTFPSSSSNFMSTSPSDLKISIDSTRKSSTSQSNILKSSSNSKFASSSNLKRSTKSSIKSTIKQNERTLVLSKLITNSPKSSTVLPLLDYTISNQKQFSNYYESNTKPSLQTNRYSESTKKMYASNVFRNEKTKPIQIDSIVTPENSYSRLISNKNINLNTYVSLFTDSSSSDFGKKTSYFQTEKPYFNREQIYTEDNVIITKRPKKTSKKSTGIFLSNFLINQISKSTNRKSFDLQFKLINTIKPVHRIIEVNRSTYRSVNSQIPAEGSLLMNLFSKHRKAYFLENISFHKSTHKRHSSEYFYKILNSNKLLQSSKIQLTTTQKVSFPKSISTYKYFIRSTTKENFLITSNRKHEIKTKMQTIKKKRITNKNEKKQSIAEKLTLALRKTPKVIFICFSVWFAMIVFLLIIIILKVKKIKKIRKQKRSSSLPKDNGSLKLSKKETLTVKSLNNHSFSKYESILINLDNENREII